MKIIIKFSNLFADSGHMYRAIRMANKIWYTIRVFNVWLWTIHYKNETDRSWRGKQIQYVYQVLLHSWKYDL